MSKKSLCCVKKARKKYRKPYSYKDMAILMKALAHPVRVQIVKMLKTRKSCICGEIVDEIPLAQATVSQHLKVLNQAGFIRGEISGPKICYCLEPETLKVLKKIIMSF